MHRVLGIDPGLRHTGWAIIEVSLKSDEINYIESGVIKTDSTTALSKRLLEVHLGIIGIAKNHHIKHAAIEETFVNKNFISSLKLSQARAAALLTLEALDLAPHEYAATVVKKTITGNGHADKEQMFKMLKLLIKGTENVTSHDAADAIAIALCHVYLNKRTWS